MPLTNVTRWSCIVIVEVTIDGEDTVVGVLVDAMGQVIELSPKDIERPPAFGTRARADYLRGMGKVGTKFVMILDLDRSLGRRSSSTRRARGCLRPHAPARLRTRARRSRNE
jgi:purine-binding chemotaxis protein CheW